MQERREALALALTFGCLACLVYIAWSDWRSFRVPDHATLPLGLGGLVWAYLYASPVVHVVAAIIAAGVFLALAIGYERLRKVEGLGLGDVKLVAAGALWVGSGIALATALGAGAALAVTLLRMRLGHAGMTDPIPFGAYLAAGIGAVFLLT